VATRSPKSRFKPLSKAEREICRRVGDCRRYERINQTAFGKKIGLTRAQLANIESMRVPLRFWTGWRICESLNVNQLWLASGAGHPWPFYPLALSKFASGVTERSLFGEVCLGTLGQHLKAREELAAAMRYRDGAAVQLMGTWESAVEALVRHFLLMIPDHAQVRFFSYLSDAADEFVKKLEK
jgi:DNA-binding XRE family transcriptional regulator